MSNETMAVLLAFQLMAVDILVPLATAMYIDRYWVHLNGFLFLLICFGLFVLMNKLSIWFVERIFR